MRDIEGNVYTTIKIGNQVWTAENLKTTKYNDGTPIPHITYADEWSNLITPGYCYYNNNADNKAKYGALYNFHAVDTGKLAPKGWHVPTGEEWRELEYYLDRGEFLNSSTLPGGCRGNNGCFGGIGHYGHWWSATEVNASYAYYRCLYYYTESLGRSRNYKKYGFSVRLVRDIK